ncbi:exosortase Y-associated Wzy-like protein [Pedobacter faecalis]|uniref:exosortase Y-associated Wzy-like protein n=1 Tax=Pedobacter faecalis TaxID=3041495 RepID=UPI00254F4D8E|nr:hypothetical protein [Pedobacter sp. ELA7]
MYCSNRTSLISLIFVPWLVSEAVQLHPISSYLIAWLGSFFIFYLTIISPQRCIPEDIPIYAQVMRPIILVQVIFAGFMCCTSIFYFLNHTGFYPDDRTENSFFETEDTELLAKCQRLCLLAHCSIATGIISRIKADIQLRYKLTTAGLRPFLQIGILAYTAALLAELHPSLYQLTLPLRCISCASGAYLLIKGMVGKKVFPAVFGGTLFLLHLLSSTLTGYKENIIVNIIVLASIGFAYYRKWVIALAVPLLVTLTYVLPTFTIVFRKQSWEHHQSREEARAQAYQTLTDETKTPFIEKNSLDFLTHRLSEIGMFMTFVRNVPLWNPYSMQALENAVLVFVPRFFWDSKPSMEELAMERVYTAGVANRSSAVSAKTRPVVDGYLFGGSLGIFIYMLLYGVLAQSICNYAEQNFGGYPLGCIIIFNSVFQPLWRGNAFEFLLNNIVYGWLLMICIHKILLMTNTLVSNHENNPHNAIL